MQYLSRYFRCDHMRNLLISGHHIISNFTFISAHHLVPPTFCIIFIIFLLSLHYLSIKVYILGWYSCCISFWISFKMKYNFLSFLLPQGGSEVWNVWFQDGVFVLVWPEIDIKALISMHKCQCTNNCPVSKTWCWLKLFYYNVQLWLILCDRLAIYYLNAVSKGYQQANMDLKRKMQMVSRRAGLLVLFLYF